MNILLSPSEVLGSTPPGTVEGESSILTGKEAQEGTLLPLEMLGLALLARVI
jgi:hypothetical protein